MRTHQLLLKSHRCPVWLRALFTLLLGALLLAAGNVHAQGTSGETITYIHTDIGGSPLAATDANGTVVWKESYRGYGQRWLYQGSSAGQPSQAPSAASSLKSPAPMPSLPVTSLNSQ